MLIIINQYLLFIKKLEIFIYLDKEVHIHHLHLGLLVVLILDRHGVHLRHREALAIVVHEVVVGKKIFK